MRAANACLHLLAPATADELVRPVNAVDLKSPRGKSPRTRRDDSRHLCFAFRSLCLPGYHLEVHGTY